MISILQSKPDDLEFPTDVEIGFRLHFAMEYKNKTEVKYIKHWLLKPLQ